MNPLWATVALTALIAACKPPPTDADVARETPQDVPSFASAPLPSPYTENAVWARSTSEGRIVYGTPGQPPLISLECLESRNVQITRNSLADEDASALLALIGNGHIGRLKVDAVEENGQHIWLGALPATDNRWETLLGPRQLAATVPGAGTVVLNASPMPGRLISACRTGNPLAAPVPVEESESEELEASGSETPAQ